MTRLDLEDAITQWIDERLNNIYPYSLNQLDIEQLANYILKLKTLFPVI